MISIRVQSGGGIVKSEAPDKGCWIDARDVTTDDLARLENEFGISSELLTDIMDTDEQARIEKEDEYLAIIIRLPVLGSESEISYFTVPLGIILFPDKIVTVCQKASDAVRDIAHNKVRGLVMRNQAAFVLNILSRAAFTFLRALKQLNKDANGIEQTLQKSVQNNELIQLLSLQKSLVYFTTSIKSNELILEKMQKVPFLRLKEEEQELLEDVITENVQAMEMANIYSSILTGTMDAFASVISNNQNIVMKRLTIVNIILMIPTLIYSFYGMNVSLPFQSDRFTTIGIVFFSLLASTVGVILLNFNSQKKSKRVKRFRTP
ncbi:MAG: magnesium transporter CorA family protein [Termitinemataceae bacterium]|nr:MAG: magnesium transporter CorA family protein [Termitinemataceae bacterium]